MRVGDWVVAIGNPFGLGGTVTAGIVSAQQRDISAGPYDDFIQTDASINRGNSGGPMFNLKGEVIGINTAIFSPSGGSVGIGFAVPANLCKPVIDQILKYGHTRRGWLGVRIQSVTEDIAESLGLKEAKGALIASVTDTGPAQKAGLRSGDIITHFDGREVNAMRSLPRMVAETDIGKTVDVTYWRDGKELTTRVKVGELEVAEKEGLVDTDEGAQQGEEDTQQGDTVLVKAVGMSLSAIHPQDRDKYQIDKDLNGVLVASVESNSEALVKGLQQGDVIEEINQQAVTDPAAAADMIEKAAAAKRKSVLLLIHRQADVSFVALRLDSKHSKDTAREKSGKNATPAPDDSQEPDDEEDGPDGQQMP
jgi:serine protease Do